MERGLGHSNQPGAPGGGDDPDDDYDEPMDEDDYDEDYEGDEEEEPIDPIPVPRPKRDGGSSGRCCGSLLDYHEVS